MSVRSRLRITTRQLEALVAFLKNNKENLAENRKLLQNEAGIVGRKQMDKLKIVVYSVVYLMSLCVKSVHTGENSQILTVSNKKQY
jgi:hypothetical protein